MSSSQPVITPNAINFTPDNKHAYAYSGNKAIINAEQTMIEGNTNSEYIRCKISISNFSGSGDDIRYYVYFNDVEVFGAYYNSTANNNIVIMPLYITIPPFTEIKITAQNLSSSSERAHTAVLVGEAVGMVDVGYQ